MLTADAKQPPQLDTLAGRGHTVLRQVSADGIEQTSTGDTLDAKFRPSRAGRKTQLATAARAAGGPAAFAGSAGLDTLASAVQQGHVDDDAAGSGEGGREGAATMWSMRRRSGRRTTAIRTA